MSEPSCHRCNGFLEPDATCANYYCPNFTFKPPMKEENKSDTPETDAKLKQCVPPMTAESAFQEMLIYSRKLERERDEARRWVEAGKINLTRCAKERDDLLQAISNFKKAKGRFNTQLAAEKLIAMLPEFYQ